MSSFITRLVVSTAAGVAVVCGTGVIAAAQTNACPVVSTTVVSDALGTPVTANTTAGGPAGFDLCEFVDPSGTSFGVYREANAFDAGTPVGAAGLVSRYVPSLPAAVRDQIDALGGIGINVAPGYEIAAISGVGDSAVWVKTELLPGVYNDSLLVQRGSDGYNFNGDDSPATQDRLTTLALAVLAAQ
jgi:hypothetical protein